MEKGNVPFSVVSLPAVPESLLPTFQFLAPIYRAPVLSLAHPGRRRAVPSSTPLSSRPLCSQAVLRGRGGSVPSCRWEKTGQKGTDSGWTQSSLKSRALGREHRQWRLLNRQEFLGRAKSLLMLLTPFMRLKPGLASEQHIAVGEAQTGQQGLPDSHTS